MDLIKIRTNIEEFDIRMTEEEFVSLVIAAASTDNKLKFSLGTIDTHYKGEMYDDTINVTLDLEHVKILAIESHSMVKKEKVSKK